mmetsp:Transcript_5790/g.10365  ORF Transcript_5790/g.10365 Transcript_5790/m.10365 type:complete len:242 (+) Transcript_5790:521-1246(+)
MSATPPVGNRRCTPQQRKGRSMGTAWSWMTAGQEHSAVAGEVDKLSWVRGCTRSTNQAVGSMCGLWRILCAVQDDVDPTLLHPQVVEPSGRHLPLHLLLDIRHHLVHVGDVASPGLQTGPRLLKKLLRVDPRGFVRSCKHVLHNDIVRPPLGLVQEVARVLVHELRLYKGRPCLLLHCAHLDDLLAEVHGIDFLNILSKQSLPLAAKDTSPNTKQKEAARRLVMVEVHNKLIDQLQVVIPC